MPVKPETQFIQHLHKALQRRDDNVYCEKTHNPYRGGVPDVYYDYPGYDMWVEYKYMEAVPRTLTVARDKDGSKPLLSALQCRWLERAHGNGRLVRVAIGFGKGKSRRVLLVEPLTPWWFNPMEQNTIETNLLTVDETVDRYLELLQYGT